MSCTDYQMTVFGPSLLERFRNVAPGAVLHLETMSNRFGDELESSHVDLAIAPFLGDATPEYIFFSLPVKPNLTWERSYADHNVCMMAGSHPLSDNKELSLAEYLDCDHIVTTTQYGVQASVDVGLMAIGSQRRSALSVPCYEAAVLAVAGTRLTTTLPARLAAVYQDPVTTKVLSVPTEIRILRSYLMWHPRLNSDPRQQWFRQLVRQTLPALEEPPLTAAGVGGESRVRQWQRLGGRQ
jgi:DNA-binding transcriptional LysR family regulator